jgi:valyl-tRNA synthetase
MLQLLHPFMPFVTEELWQALNGSDKNSIMVSSFPQPVESWEDAAAKKEMELLMEIITSIRNIRGEMRIPPSSKLQVSISAPDMQLKNAIESGKNYIVNMANLEELTLAVDLVATGIVGLTRIFVPVTGIVDIAGEKTRLDKELAKVSKDLEQSFRKLANRDFREKAAEAAIKKEEDKLKDFQEKFTALKAALKKLKEIAV